MGNITGRFSKFERKLPSVDGKVFVITGTTSGTGFIAAETVAKHGGEVLLLNRSSPRSIASLEKLQAAVPTGKFVPIDCDLQDFKSVKNAAEEIKSKGYTEIYCLCNNAGIMAVNDTITKADGYEVQMQTNHLSHFLLTKELFPLLKAASKKYGDARIVQHSSLARLMTENKCLEEKYFLHQSEDGQLGGNEVPPGGGMKMTGGPWYRYHQTKLANSVFSHALADRLSASKDLDCQNIFATCGHPGVSRTNLFDHLNGQSGIFMRSIVLPLFSFLMFQSAADGSMGILRCMMDDKSTLNSGTLYGPALKLGDGSNADKPIKTSFTGWAVANPTLSYEVDTESKDMLWMLSEKATGIKFDIP